MANFSFNNQSTGSAYFVYETIADAATGRYISGSLKAASGSFTNFTGSNSNLVIQSDYIWGVVVPPSASNVDFNAAVTVPTGSVRFRGTGNLTVTITT